MSLEAIKLSTATKIAKACGLFLEIGLGHATKMAALGRVFLLSMMTVPLFAPGGNFPHDSPYNALIDEAIYIC